MFSSNTSQVSGGAADPYFDYVTMLLHGDGTNGGQNNTFVDSSTNNFSITRNGNATQGSFSPYGTLWSNYFGSGNSIYISTSSVFAFSGDFTVEAWVFVNNTSTSGGFDPRLINIGGGIDILFVDSSKAVQVKNSSTTVVTSSSNAIALNTWQHVAIVRSGSTVTIYVNGTSVGSASYSSTFSDVGDARIARLEGSGSGYLDGYISNLRIVKGSAVYTGSFTPSTTPLTAITNTVLLTCQSNRFRDNSSSNFSLTPSGSPSVQRFNPFAPSAEYSTATIGGSGYFDGSGDYLSIPNNAAFTFGTGDFTVECWAYFNGTNGSGFLGGTATGGMDFAYESGSLRIGRLNTAWDSTFSWTPTTGQWYHIAFTRSSGTVRAFVNGSQVGSSLSNSTSYSQNGGTSSVGLSLTPADRPHNGYFCDTRVVKGVALYTTTFTPPTSPLSAVSNTSLLFNYTNAAIFDNAMICDIETAGNAQISTSVVKYGTGSLRNPATTTGSGFKSISNGVRLSGDFTIEWWAYHDNLNTGSNHVMLGPWGINSSPILVRVDNGATLQIYMANTGPHVSVAVGSSGITATTWQHYAITRSGGTCRFFVSGVQVGSSWSLSTVLDFSIVSLMSENAGTSTTADQMPGYMDDVRITNGIARYTANFTPPTAAFPNT